VLYVCLATMDWQMALVIGIELAAVAFLLQRLFAGRRPRSAPSAKPDVPASALVRKRASRFLDSR